MGQDGYKYNDASTSYPDGLKATAYIATEVEGDILISCGGSIISTRTVLTSAHCVLKTQEPYILVGSHNINLSLPIEQSSVSGGQLRKAAKMIVHEKFGTHLNYDYDVALASFDEELTFGANQRRGYFIQLMQNLDSVSFIELRWKWARLEEPVYMFGWKHSSSNGKLNVKLRWANTSMACRSKGRDLAEPGSWDNLNIYTDGILFVKDKIGSASLCHGDMGSPLVQGGTQIGIASFGVDYDCKGLNAISSIRRHVRWIEKNKAMLEGQNVIEGQKLVYQKEMKIVASSEKVLGNRKSQASVSMEPRIKNGTRVESPETFPFMNGLAIYFTDDPAKYNYSVCGGSILTQWIILTAAHCVAHNLPLIVYAGIIDQDRITEQDQAIRMKDYRVHPDYIDGYNYADIGLILLSSPLKFNNRVAPVCQLTKKDPPDGTPLHIAGWGYLGDKDEAEPSSYLSVTTLVMYRPIIYSGEIRFAVSTTSACLGDSGSPYFNDEHEVAGVMSNAWPGSQIHTCNHTYVAAISTAEYHNWTLDTLQELEALVEE